MDKFSTVVQAICIATYCKLHHYSHVDDDVSSAGVFKSSASAESRSQVRSSRLVSPAVAVYYCTVVYCPSQRINAVIRSFVSSIYHIRHRKDPNVIQCSISLSHEIRLEAQELFHRICPAPLVRRTVLLSLSDELLYAIKISRR